MVANIDFVIFFLVVMNVLIEVISITVFALRLQDFKQLSKYWEKVTFSILTIEEICLVWQNNVLSQEKGDDKEKDIKFNHDSFIFLIINKR